MKMTGNKGEWSELYALIELMHTGKLYAADANARKINDIYFPILRILRHNDSDNLVDYILHDNVVDVLVDGVKVTSLSKAYLCSVKTDLYQGICSGVNRAFEIQGFSEVMKMMQINKIKASSSEKADIVMQIHDIHTGYEPVCGFSIKSELGNPPTLLNASGATNFIYEIKGVSGEDIECINAIDSRNKILDRIAAISEKGIIKFVRVANSNFAANLMLIDSYMDEIISIMLLDYYNDKASTCKDLVDLLEENNPLGYPRKGFYTYKMKKFLCSVALGMIPSKEWNGQDEANGGYVIVTETGDVLAYHIYNRAEFENYLLLNTKFERGSTSKHGFASLYQQDGNVFIKLNLQIRFK